MPTVWNGLLQIDPHRFFVYVVGVPALIAFFMLLVLASITSAISMQEVVTSTFVDLFGGDRVHVTIVTGVFVFMFGIPSALSGTESLFGTSLLASTGKTFLEWVDLATTDWLLPLDGLILAVFTGFFLHPNHRHREFCNEPSSVICYDGWVTLLRYVVPFAVLIIFLESIGIIKSNIL